MRNSNEGFQGLFHCVKECYSLLFPGIFTITYYYLLNHNSIFVKTGINYATAVALFTLKTNSCVNSYTFSPLKNVSLLKTSKNKMKQNFNNDAIVLQINHVVYFIHWSQKEKCQKDVKQTISRYKTTAATTKHER